MNVQIDLTSKVKRVWLVGRRKAREGNPMQGARITDPVAARAFVLAGDARFTLVSQRTGARFTYRVVRADEGKDSPWFVRLLNGPDNTADYVFLGTIWPDADGERYKHSFKSPVATRAQSVQAFMWFLHRLVHGELHPECELWHEGRCGRCGRALTVPESIASGIGPVCAQS